jgi:hypothetical protein
VVASRFLENVCTPDNNNNNNNNNNNSVQFNGYLLTCRLTAQVPITKPAQSTNKTQNSTNTQSKTLKKQNKNKYVVKQYKISTGAEIQYLDRT